MTTPTNWLLLRGLAREQRHWSEFPDVLARTVPGVTVHRLDLPGAGTECQRATPLSVPAMAEDVRARWLALRDRHPGSWGLFGISLGGMVSIAWCGAHPGDFERLVVVNSSVSDLSPAWHRMTLGSAGTVLKVLATSDGLTRERLVIGMTTTQCKDTEERARTWATYQDDRPMQRANVIRQVLAASRFRAPASVGTPMLVLIGARDGLCNPSCPRAIAERYGAPFRVHPTGGHDLSTDDPAWMAEQVRDWVGASAGG